MTDSKYLVAVDLLKKRYAKPSIIQHSHINQLISLTRCSMKATSLDYERSGIKLRLISEGSRPSQSRKHLTPQSLYRY